MPWWNKLKIAHQNPLNEKKNIHHHVLMSSSRSRDLKENCSRPGNYETCGLNTEINGSFWVKNLEVFFMRVQFDMHSLSEAMQIQHFFWKGMEGFSVFPGQDTLCCHCCRPHPKLPECSMVITTLVLIEVGPGFPWIHQNSSCSNKNRLLIGSCVLFMKRSPILHDAVIVVRWK